MEREEWNLGVLGKRGVGVNAFVTQHICNHFLDEYDPTIGEDSYRKQSMIDEQVCLYELDIYHYDPEDPYSNIIWYEQNFRLRSLRLQGCILAYSHTDRATFDEIPNLIERLMRIRDVEEMIPMVIIETKCDLAERRAVPLEEGRNLAQSYGAPFFSTSAKDRINVEEAVFELIRILRKRRDDALVPQKKKKVKPVKPMKKIIPQSTIVLPQVTSTLVDDIHTYLLDVEKYSDLVLTIGDRKIYVHKAVLFSRLPSFMEKIKRTDKVMDLSDLNYSVVLSIMKYLYTGKFKRENFDNELYKPAIMKLEVFNLLPILKADHVEIEGFDPKFERLFNLNFSSDLKMVVKDSKKNQHEIFCHKMILCARSNYFRTMYHGGFKESDAAELVIADCSYEAMLFLIQYYYLDVKQLTDETIVCDVLRVAHMYDEKPVVQLVESYLHNHLSIENVCFVLMSCSLFSLSSSLKLACEEFISYRYKKVSKTSAFKKLSTDVQKQLQASQKEGPWEIPKHNNESQTLLEQFKSFTL